MYVKALFNQTDTLALNFDTGTMELVLINGVLQHKLTAAPKLYSISYALKIGKTIYQTKVYDAKLTVQETDGRFGWDLFKIKVEELNYDRNIVVVDSLLSKSVAEDKRYTKLAIEFYKELLLITSSIKQDGCYYK